MREARTLRPGAPEPRVGRLPARAEAVARGAAAQLRPAGVPGRVGRPQAAAPAPDGPGAVRAPVHGSDPVARKLHGEAPHAHDPHPLAGPNHVRRHLLVQPGVGARGRAKAVGPLVAFVVLVPPWAAEEAPGVEGRGGVGQPGAAAKGVRAVLQRQRRRPPVAHVVQGHELRHDGAGAGVGADRANGRNGGVLVRGRELAKLRLHAEQPLKEKPVFVLAPGLELDHAAVVAPCVVAAVVDQEHARARRLQVPPDLGGVERDGLGGHLEVLL
mmetsp:Transcript_9469/g.32259  ORF Transcript_9469/g.32259 Transcript_9469/m.32259 type:complete len:271 (+) Transcript_9469:415-1227(+)